MIPLLVALALAVIGSAFWAATVRQKRATRRMVGALVHAAAAPRAPRPPSDDGVDVPPPVLRYLRRALAPDRQLRIARLRQVGELRTDPLRDRWLRFEAEHVAAPAATGFVWNARVKIAPLLHVRVRDAFLDGEGSGHVSLLSAFTVASDAGTPQMRSGALHRYLAEAVWYPVALVPSAGLAWSPIDEHRALATLTSHGVSVSLEFRFAETGEVTGIYTPARWGKFGRGYAQRAWEGRFRGYREWDGLLVPSEGEVGWFIDGEWRRVWIGRIVELETDETSDRSS